MKKIIIALIILVAGMQLIPVKRTNPEVVYDFDGPAEVKTILQKSCYDCHSHETKWPWYSYVAPMSWLVAHDVKDGRAHLNFSDWAPLKNIVYIHQEMAAEVAEGKMPLKAYLLAHPEAAVTPAELAILKDWAGIASSDGAGQEND